MDELPDDIPIADYIKCADCGTLILESWGLQTGRRCITCWTDRHPLATLEVMNRSVRMSARQLFFARYKYRYHYVREADRTGKKARQAAYRRLATVFPDVYAMLVDEERAKRGMAPIAHYESIDFEATASKTLAFEDVYDALDSEGVNDE